MGEPEWFFLSHEQFDGLGGLAHVQRTVFQRPMQLPRTAERALGRWSRVLAALRCLLRRSPRPLPWRDEDRGFRALEPAQSLPSALSWALLSESETLNIREQARRRGVSINAWLLWCLSQATLPRLLPGRGCFEWIVPLNMRGAVSMERDTANMAWTLDVAFPKDAGPERIHALIREQIARREHWGAWQLLSLFRYLAPAALRAVARREMQVRKHGCFSNLGRLESSPGEREAEWWMAFNPVLRSRPVGAASLTWGDRLALTLQLHPALSREPDDARTWLNDWTQRALARGEYSGARCLSPRA
jgi:hypothetical protein